MFNLIRYRNPKYPLLKKIKELFQKLRRDNMAKWQRCLPFNELFTDRWEKAQFLSFGKGTSIYDSSIVIGDVKVGENTWIGPYTILDGSGGLVIGDNCSISAGVQIYTHDTVKWALSGGQERIDHATTTISSRCYIGPNTIITKGVTIEEGCVIGANSLVLDNIPTGSKAWGIPCKIQGPADEFFKNK